MVGRRGGYQHPINRLGVDASILQRRLGRQHRHIGGRLLRCRAPPLMHARELHDVVIGHAEPGGQSPGSSGALRAGNTPHRGYTPGTCTLPHVELLDCLGQCVLTRPPALPSRRRRKYAYSGRHQRHPQAPRRPRLHPADSRPRLPAVVRGRPLARRPNRRSDVGKDVERTTRRVARDARDGVETRHDKITALLEGLRHAANTLLRPGQGFNPSHLDQSAVALLVV